MFEKLQMAAKRQYGGVENNSIIITDVLLLHLELRYTKVHYNGNLIASDRRLWPKKGP